MKKNYLVPEVCIVNVEPHAHILDGSPVRSISSESTGLRYGGGSSTAGNPSARVKDATEAYDVWQDDWSAE